MKRIGTASAQSLGSLRRALEATASAVMIRPCTNKESSRSVCVTRRVGNTICSMVGGHPSTALADSQRAHGISCESRCATLLKREMTPRLTTSPQATRTGQEGCVGTLAQTTGVMSNRSPAGATTGRRAASASAGLCRGARLSWTAWRTQAVVLKCSSLCCLFCLPAAVQINALTPAEWR